MKPKLELAGFGKPLMLISKSNIPFLTVFRNLNGISSKRMLEDGHLGELLNESLELKHAIVGCAILGGFFGRRRYSLTPIHEFWTKNPISGN